MPPSPLYHRPGQRIRRQGRSIPPKSKSLRQAAGSSLCHGTGTRTLLTSGTSGTGSTSETSTWTRPQARAAKYRKPHGRARITVPARTGICSGRGRNGPACTRYAAVPRQISRPAMAALTWAGLIEWPTINVQVVVQVGLRRRLRGLLATRSGPIAAWPRRGFARVLVSIGALAQSVRRPGWLLTRQLGTLRTAWLARKRERAGLTGNGPTYLAPDRYAACAGILSARPACINMQAGLPHMELTWAAERSTSRKSLR